MGLSGFSLMLFLHELASSSFVLPLLFYQICESECRYVLSSCVKFIIEFTAWFEDDMCVVLPDNYNNIVLNGFTCSLKEHYSYI